MNSSVVVTLSSTPDLCDQYPNEIQVCQEDWRHYGGLTHFYGEIETVKCFEDNSFVKKCLNTPGNGRVLVVDGGGSYNRALLGDQIAQSAVDNGWRGVIIRGAVRDVEILRGLPLGILALGSSPMRTDRQDQGLTNLTVSIGGIRIHPRSWVCADLNGLIVSSKSLY